MTASGETRSTSLLDVLPIRATLLQSATSKRAALYVRVSTSDRGQTVENQLQPLQEAAGRLGWTVVAMFRDEGSVAPGARQAAWTGCAAEGRGPARLRHRVRHGRCGASCGQIHCQGLIMRSHLTGCPRPNSVQQAARSISGRRSAELVISQAPRPAGPASALISRRRRDRLSQGSSPARA